MLTTVRRFLADEPGDLLLSSGSVIWPATARTERIMNASPSGKAPESTETT